MTNAHPTRGATSAVRGLDERRVYALQPCTVALLTGVALGREEK